MSILLMSAAPVLFSAASASALEGHAFSSSFSGTGTNALAAPKGLAVAQSSGEIYVVDSSNDRVEVFNAGGTFVSAFGKKGTGAGQFTAPSEIAVDNSGGLPGNVYVLDNGENRIEVFNSKGVFQSEITKAQIIAVTPNEGVNFQGVTSVATDSAGDLWIYVKETSSTSVDEVPAGGALKFAFPSNRTATAGFAAAGNGELWAINGSGLTHYSQAGAFLEGIGFGEAPTATGLAIDTANEGFFVVRGTTVAHFPAPHSNERKPSDFFGPEAALGAGSGAAVDNATGKVYVADTKNNKVDIFSPTTEASVELGAASGVTGSGATLHGTVDPEGLPVTRCEFEYGTAEGSPSSTAPCVPAPGSGNAPEAVSAVLAGLTPGKTYFFRLSATDSSGTSTGGYEASFKTPVPPTEVETGGAESVAEASAKLTGKLNPQGGATYWFEYGEAACGAETCGTKTEPEGGPLTGKVQEAVAPVEVKGLKAATTYHYWLVAKNAGGIVHGAAHEFKTTAAAVEPPAEVETGAAEQVSETAAKLTGKLNPKGGATYWFEYGEAACGASSCGAKTEPEGGPLTGKAQEAVSPVEVTGLKAATTYHYWLVAKNAGGTVHGAAEEFTTGAAAPKVTLTIERYGEGTVTSAPAGINCGTGVGCTAELPAGRVVLTEKPASGYEFAGWIGCKRIEATDTCEITLSAAAEVGAVFLKAGTEGPAGKEGKEGPTGKEGPQGKEGPAGGEGPAGKEGAAGKEGPAGREGAAGAEGAAGKEGPAGREGPAGKEGPRGPQGLPGTVDIVTCKVVIVEGKKIRKCTVKTVPGPVKIGPSGVTTTAKSSRAVISRRGLVYAAGTASRRHGALSLRLSAYHRLRPGRYTLTLIEGSGACERIRSESFLVSAPRRR